MHQRQPSWRNNGQDVPPGNTGTAAPQAVAFPSASTLSKNVAQKVLSSRKIQASIGLWVVGIFFMLFAPSPVQLTPEVQSEYNHLIHEATTLDGYSQAYRDVMMARQNVQDSKVWFWRFNAKHKQNVATAEKKLEEKELILHKIELERDEMVSKAKNIVGIWSEIGLQEGRKRFWDAFESGKVFAQRQSFYQMMSTVLFSSREENVLSLILNWVITALINFTICLIGALIYFFGSLVSMIWTYQPNPASALVFFALCFLGGVSVVSAYLLGMYGMVMSGTYVVGNILLRDANQRRIRDQQYRQQYLHRD